MLMEIETVLHIQEPVIKPAWSTFDSSVSGIWKGVGAVFSPFTAELEPIGLGNKNENLFDCYILFHIERSPSGEIIRKTYWVALNPLGEKRQHEQGSYKDNNSESKRVTYDVVNPDLDLPSYESFDFRKSEVLKEDLMNMEPGLVFFDDGAYSRGPVEIPVGEPESPTFNEGGSDIQIIRVAVYEEQWVSPVNLYDAVDNQADPKPISQRRRTQPSELAGLWKVFEVSAMPIFNEESTMVEEGSGPPYVYLCMETLKKRWLPEISTYFGEEEMLDMNDLTVLWLPGCVTGYVDVKEDGILRIGVG